MGRKLFALSIKATHKFLLFSRLIFSKKMLKKLSLIISLLALSSCFSRFEKHGYMFELSEMDMLQEGVTSKERVLKIMGSPTLVSDLGNEETWIYYSENVKHLLFFNPTIFEREVVVMNFGENGVIQNLNKITLSDEDHTINFATNYTATDDHETSLIKSFFGNVGSVKAAQ